MKRRILCFLCAAAMTVTPIAASAEEVTADENTGLVMGDAEEVLDEENGISMLDTESEEKVYDEANTEDFSNEEEGLIFGDVESDDELVGTTYDLTLGSESINSYIYVKAWTKKYIYNASGYTISNSNVYVDGTYQFQNRSFYNGRSTYIYDNSSKDAVCYFKYNADAHTLLTTWAYADDWQFYDVFPSVVDWQYEGVKYCYEKKYMVGTGNNKFDPNEVLNRAMVAKVIHNMNNNPSASVDDYFTDVAANTWYSEAVAWCYQQGIINGYSEGVFGPFDPITREQMVAMLYRYGQYKGYALSGEVDLAQFNDGEQVSGWARPAFRWAVANGILKGNNNKVYPKGSTTRAECATMIKRFVDAYGN